MFQHILRRCGWWALVAALCSFSGLAAAQTKLQVGYIPAADWLPVLVAKDAGLFQKRQLDVTLTKVALGSNMPAALMSGSLDIGASTPPVLIDTAVAGLGLVGLVGTSRLVKNPALFALVARTGVKVESARDLVGKRVGVPGLRATGDLMLRKWLMDRGVQPSSVVFVEAPFPQMKDLLKAGTLDVVVVVEPFRSRIVGDGTGYWLADFVADVNPDLAAGVWVAKREWAVANARTIQAFREALVEATAFIEQQRDAARAIELKYLGFNSPVLPAFNPALSAADLNAYVAVAKAVGYLQGPVDAEKLVLR